MLSRASRFRGHNSLKSIYKYGKSISAAQLTLKYLELKSDKPARVAVVVSRKVNKRAVIRNKIRRRIYEQVRLKITDRPLKADIVLIVYGDQFASMPTKELASIINELLTKSQVIEKN